MRGAGKAPRRSRLLDFRCRQDPCSAAFSPRVWVKAASTPALDRAPARSSERRDGFPLIFFFSKARPRYPCSSTIAQERHRRLRTLSHGGELVESSRSKRHRADQTGGHARLPAWKPSSQELIEKPFGPAIPFLSRVDARTDRKILGRNPDSVALVTRSRRPDGTLQGLSDDAIFGASVSSDRERTTISSCAGSVALVYHSTGDVGDDVNCRVCNDCGRTWRDFRGVSRK